MSCLANWNSSNITRTSFETTLTSLTRALANIQYPLADGVGDDETQPSGPGADAAAGQNPPGAGLRSSGESSASLDFEEKVRG